MKPGFVIGTTAIVSCAAGSVAGYFFARRQLESTYQTQVKEELAQAKDFYSRLYKKDQFKTPEEAAKELIPEDVQETLGAYRGEPKIILPEALSRKEQKVNYSKSPEPKDVNIFADVTPADIEKEVRDRTEEAPYIISLEEFLENGEEHSQVTVTYYEADGVLADERDEVISASEMIGNYNIIRIGHRSNDPNVLYVRNHVLGTDFEVCRSTGSYKREVAGLDD